jgi:hypothetical protein
MVLEPQVRILLRCAEKKSRGDFHLPPRRRVWHLFGYRTPLPIMPHFNGKFEEPAEGRNEGNLKKPRLSRSQVGEFPEFF